MYLHTYKHLLNNISMLCVCAVCVYNSLFVSRFLADDVFCSLSLRSYWFSWVGATGAAIISDPSMWVAREVRERGQEEEKSAAEALWCTVKKWCVTSTGLDGAVWDVRFLLSAATTDKLFVLGSEMCQLTLTVLKIPRWYWSVFNSDSLSCNNNHQQVGWRSPICKLNISESSQRWQQCKPPDWSLNISCTWQEQSCRSSF